MPRKRRIFKQNFFHHVMFRGINGENIFFDDRDRIRFCLLLQEACEKHCIKIHGFCFMSNHIHLILQPFQDSFHRGIHAFSFRYAQYFNRRHKRRGYLFQGRFRSIMVEDGGYLKRLIRYVHLNPITSKIKLYPDEYRWSSYRAYLNQDKFVWLETEQILSRFGNSSHEAMQNLISYTHQKLDADYDLVDITKALRKGFFGNDDAFTKIAELNQPTPQVKSLTLNPQVTIHDVILSICRCFDISQEDLTGKNKSKNSVDGRSTLALISKRSAHLTLQSLSMLLGKNSGTLSRLATRAEHCPKLLERVYDIEQELNKLVSNYTRIAGSQARPLLL